jgi:hypothetical protein
VLCGVRIRTGLVDDDCVHLTDRHSTTLVSPCPHYCAAFSSSPYLLFTVFCKQVLHRKIWRFHGGDYEECRLLGYKNPVLTSQETHYVSTTELSRLMLCKIWGYHGRDYKECRLPSSDVSEERIASIIRANRISELWKTLAVTSNWNTLRIATSKVVQNIWFFAFWCWKR